MIFGKASEIPVRINFITRARVMADTVPAPVVIGMAKGIAAVQMIFGKVRCS